MARPKIKTALAGILILLGAAFALFSGFAVNRLAALNDEINLIATNTMPTMASVKDMEVQLGNIRTAYRSHILRSDVEGKAAAAKSIEQAVATLKADIEKFNSLAPTKEESEQVALVGTSIDQYVKIGERVLTISSAGDLNGANSILREEMVSVADAARVAIARLVELSNATAAEAYAGANAVYATTLTITLGAIGSIAVLIVGAVWFAITNIAKPIQTITGSMNKLAAGDADTAVPFAGRADEIGEMAAAVEIFRKNALENRRLEQETLAQRNQTEEQRRLRSRSASAPKRWLKPQQVLPMA
jgi:methyl-accepting chemotaxis protein